MGTGAILLIIGAYIFIAATIGVILWKYCENLYDDNDAREAVPILSAVFWPAAIVIWAGYFFAKYLMNRIDFDKERSH